MGIFAYTALDGAGRTTSGTIPADSRDQAMDAVIGRGLSPIKVDEQKTAQQLMKKSTSTRVSQAAVESFTRELANLLGAGLPLSRALQLLKREASTPGSKNVWSAVHDEIIGGVSLADALAKWPKVFSTVYVAMVAAGESGGFLPIVLQQISDFRTREADLKGKVKAALVYPCVLGVFALAVVTFLLTFFIPKFQGVFQGFGAKLPALTLMMVGLSHLVVGYGWAVALVIIGAIIFIRRAMLSESGRRAFERLLLKTPALGKVTARFALVRFCRMLGTLVGSGVPLVSALRTAQKSLGNQTLADAVGHAIEEVQRGTALSKSLAATPILFPASVVEMVAIAEETGRLDKELQRLSIAYESDLDRQLRMLVALAEPIMLFITAAVIGTVVVAMLLPILDLQDVVK
jgi:type II secretory pathway component PulF